MMNPCSSGSELRVFRPDYLLEVTSNDRKVFERFVELFLKNCPDMVRRITEAHRQADFRGVRHAAHTLCGSAGSFGAERLQASTRELDIACREERFDRIGDLVDRVVQEWELLREEIARVMAE